VVREIEDLARSLVRHQHDHAPVRDLNRETDRRQGPGQRTAADLARLVGSWTFVVLQAVLSLCWLVLNVVAASDDRFGVSKLGVGVDYATGVATTDDATIASPFGASSAAIVDFETAGATHGWVGATAPKILSARNVLTHIFAPNAAMSYDVKARVPRRNGQPLRLSALRVR